MITQHAREDYGINHFLTTLLLTVTDFMVQTPAVERARQHYEQHHWGQFARP